ncbi:lactonase family protein [Xylanimonas ulmi]|uniref:6-phosphogluconolactonase (Cycloisomerase 2 family) n=1 Tax=Xylanimonas ulmi TaxID=228973 RepID=A0A4Q7M520_9MICO|nr:beta-propeller fold lactonase family protein [Xylanibacterium ulmi]RZS62123.1 6-phosphogluconolactonase (cycloisomerase 2 family) [Xylanibacterium ulmi]
MTAVAPHTLWVGSYPAVGASAGSGEGVWSLDVGADGRFGRPRLAATSPAPSFLALHPSGRTLYAVAEDAPGTVSAFPLSPDGALGAPVVLASGGAFGCHVLALAHTLWIAHYGDGVAAAVPLDPATGALAGDAVRFAGGGSGPQADRQEGPHAHFVAARGEDVLVADLGADTLRRYPARVAGPRRRPTAPAVAARLPGGAGPRHLVELPGGALVVVGELDARLHLLLPAAGGWTPVAATPVTATPVVAGARAPAGLPASSPPGPSPSHIALTGDLLTVGVRGDDVLSTHRVRVGDDGVPALDPLADIALGAGACPRHHAVLGQCAHGRLLVVVARQGAGDLAAVLVDPVTGAGEVTDAVALPTPPACVLEAA